MKRKDPFLPLFDGLPWFSDRQFGGAGLFLLRISYLLLCAMPLVLSMLDAIAGFAAGALYVIGVAALALPLLWDVVRRFRYRHTQLDVLIVLVSCGFLIWNHNYSDAAALLFFYHLADLFLCTLILTARKKCDVHVDRIFRNDSARKVRTGSLSPGDTIRVEEGEVLGVDCRLLSGSAICSLSFFDPESGEFRASEGDVLFSGTQIEEGGFTAQVLSIGSSNATRAVRRKLARCLAQTGADCRLVSRISVPIQTLFLLIVLLNVTFFDVPIGVELLAFSSLFFCFDFYLRARRALELFLLSVLLGRGIYPESIGSVLKLHTLFPVLKTVSSRAPKSRSNGKRYRLAGRMPRKAPVVLEYASEASHLIASCDFALMYREKNALLPCAVKVYEAMILYGLIAFLMIVAASISFLVLSLSASFVASCIILAVFLGICCAALTFGFSAPLRRMRY